MKIVHVVSRLDTKGGIQSFAKSIYLALRNRFESEIVDWRSSLPTGIMRLPTSIIVRRSPATLGACLYRHVFSNSTRKFQPTNDDVVHFWSLEPAITFPDMECIVSCHGAELLPKNVQSYERILYREVLSNAVIVQACSQYTAELVSRQFGVDPSKIRVIPPPIDFNILSSFARDHKPEVSVPIIGTLTRFVRRKNLPNVIKALNLLSDDLAFTYYLAGDGLEREAILRELKKGSFSWRYFGEISDEVKFQQFYPSLDVFVLPPLELPDDVEGFGTVYLEANAYGIPVVASRTGGVSDAVKEHFSGVFADPEDPEDIASKTLNLVRNKKAYMDSTKQWAERFDVKNIAEEFGKIYEYAMAQIT